MKLLREPASEQEFIYELWVNIEAEVSEALRKEVAREFAEGREYPVIRGTWTDYENRQVEQVG